MTVIRAEVDRPICDNRGTVHVKIDCFKPNPFSGGGVPSEYVIAGSEIHDPVRHRRCSNGISSEGCRV